MLTYPGTVMESDYDPNRSGWWGRAWDRPGKVVVSPPHLDPGGAGYVLTVSHTLYQGKSDGLHHQNDPVVAVLAFDITLGYLYRFLSVFQILYLMLNVHFY